MNIINNDRMTKIISVVFAVVFGVLFVSLVADAVTTISGTTLTLENSETISNGTDGTITFGPAGTIASTSAITVGDESVPTINGLSFGYCSFTDQTSFTATTTAYFDCTTTPTTALVAGDRVFVNATGSFETDFVIEAASTTGVSTIQLRVLNGAFTTADATLNGTSINFWAVR